MTDRKQTVARPHVACELTPRGVAAARSDSRQQAIGNVYSRALPDGLLTPSLNTQNVLNPEKLADEIEAAMTAIGARGHDVVAVLPDSAVRVALIDFDALPDRRSEAEAAVRFRLRKSLPFDIDKASVSFQPQQTSRGLHVVAAIILHSVLQEYESTFREAGCNPGVVIPSSLASLGAVSGNEPTLVVKVGWDATSVSVVENGHLLLFRTLEGTSGSPVSADRLSDDIYPSLVYFQDNYGVSVGRVLIAGVPNVAEISAALEMQTSAKVQELIPPSLGGETRTDFAGAIGALL